MTQTSHTVAMLTMLPSMPYTSTEGNELSMIGFGISRLLSCGMSIMGCCWAAVTFVTRLASLAFGQATIAWATE